MIAIAGKDLPEFEDMRGFIVCLDENSEKTLENASTCFLVLDRVVLQRKRCSDLFEVKGKGLSEFVFDTANSYLCCSINFSFRIT